MIWSNSASDDPHQPERGEMAARIRSHDWASTALGSPQNWPQVLHTMAELVVRSSQPMFLCWGPQRIVLYNDACADILGPGHPGALGQPLAEVWQGPVHAGVVGIVEGAFAGNATRMDDTQVSIQGPATESHLGLACTPLCNDRGEVAGVLCVCQDMTAKALAWRASRHSMLRLEMAWEGARGAVFEHSVPFDESSDLSDHWAEILGYRASDLPSYDRLPAWTFEQVHPDDRDRLTRVYQDFVSGRTERYRVEVRLRHAQGHWIWVRGIAKAVARNHDGSVQRLVGMMLDITDLKHGEEARRESEARFREMADGLPLVIWVHGADGEQEMVNETFCEFFAVTREEMKGGRWRMLVHPDDAKAYIGQFLACVRDRRPFHAEARVRRADGQWRWFESWGRPRFTATGEFCGFVGASADITDRKAAEAALRDSEERFRALADHIAQLAWMTDETGWIVWYNKRWFEYTGTTLEEMEGWGWTKVHHPDHLDRVLTKFRDCLAAGRAWEDTFPLRGNDGEYRWFLSRAVPIRDESGRVVRWFGTNTDVTEQREAEERLREADRRKDEYLAMLGHELRNPLAAIRTATELVKLARTEDPMLQRAQGALERQSSHMARLIDGLLEVSRIARGKIDVKRKTLDVRGVIEAVLHDRGGQIASRGLTLDMRVAGEPLWVSGDEVRLAQVVDNLVGNAIKFTEAPGSIEVMVYEQDGYAVICIRDTGVGIRPAMLVRVFEPFQQETQEMARAAGGLGLGLALAKGLVELHQGTIEARSQGPGTGAEFEVRLPLSPAPAHTDRIAPSARPATRRILIVEDNVDAAQMLRDLLETRGHEVPVVDNGPGALELLRHRGADVVLCDLGLPGMTGYELARAIRNDAALRHVALVALTGYGQPEDRRRTREAGFDEHLTKPVDLAALDDVLRRL